MNHPYFSGDVLRNPREVMAEILKEVLVPTRSSATFPLLSSGLKSRRPWTPDVIGGTQLVNLPDTSVVIVAATSESNVHLVSSQPSSDGEFEVIGFGRLILKDGGLTDDLGLRRVFGSSEVPSRVSWYSVPSPRRPLSSPSRGRENPR